MLMNEDSTLDQIPESPTLLRSAKKINILFDINNQQTSSRPELKAGGREVNLPMLMADVFVINGVHVQGYKDETGVYVLEAVNLLIALGFKESLAIDICNNPFYTDYTFQRVGIKPYLIYARISVTRLLTQLNYMDYISQDEATKFIEAIKTARIIKPDCVQKPASPVRVLWHARFHL